MVRGIVGLVVPLVVIVVAGLLRHAVSLLIVALVEVIVTLVVVALVVVVWLVHRFLLSNSKTPSGL